MAGPEAVSVLLTYTNPALQMMMGEASHVAILKRPTRVTARLFSPFTPEGSPPTEQFRSKTRVVRAELGNKLGKLLSTPESYTKWETMKLCSFEPAVRFQFYRELKFVEVDVCFKCEELIMRFENHEAAEDFDAIQPELLKITKQIFPGDKIISPIKPNPDAKKERFQQK